MITHQITILPHVLIMVKAFYPATAQQLQRPQIQTQHRVKIDFHKYQITYLIREIVIEYTKILDCFIISITTKREFLYNFEGKIYCRHFSQYNVPK